MAIPRKVSSLVDWSTNADARLNASPATYAISAATASAYTAVHDPFIAAVAAVAAAREAGTRSSSLVNIRNVAQKALLDFARPLYKQIQANPAVTDAAKIELGVKVPDLEPSPRPVPDRAPILRVKKVDGRLIEIDLRDPNDPDRRRMPFDVNGAVVMSYVGATEPTDPGVFSLAGTTSRTTFAVVFPESAAPGSQVWLTAAFFNERKQLGPACQPVGAHIGYGGSMPMAA